MNILLTGGTGYIGSHTAVVLSKTQHNLVIVDNFSNSEKSVLYNLELILGKKINFVEADIRDSTHISKILKAYKIDAVLHFAGLKSVGDSVSQPLEYYMNNMVGTISLLRAMKSCNVRKMVFSSSATVYGEPKYLPINESHPLNPNNPYGKSKLYIEEVLSDLSISDICWSFVCLRYFNPVGSHDSGLIGDNPLGEPNNLMPYVARVAAGSLPKLNIFGNDYETHDGTGVRDYIHVMDVAEAHLSALEYCCGARGISKINLGTGVGYSVLDIVNIFESIASKKIQYEIKSRRLGDISISYASGSLAASKLGWQSKRSIEDMCYSAYKTAIRQS